VRRCGCQTRVKHGVIGAVWVAVPREVTWVARNVNSAKCALPQLGGSTRMWIQIIVFVETVE